MNSIKKTLLTGAITALMAAAGSVQASVIDLFTQPAPEGIQSVQVGKGVNVTSNQYYNNDGSILGDYRDLSLTNVSGTSVAVAASLNVYDGRLRFSNDTGVVSTGVVQWDGNDSPTTLSYGLNANLINQVGCPVTGCQYFQAAVFYADQGYDIQLGVYTDATHYSKLNFTTSAVNNPTGVLSTFLFSWFDTAGTTEVEPGFFVTVEHGSGGKADFTTVGALELRLNTGQLSGLTTAVDLELGAITKNAPEPGALALAGIGLIGIAMSRRKRKSS